MATVPDTILTEFLEVCRGQGLTLNGPCLDVGCAGGKNFPLLPRPLYAFDIQPELVRQARTDYADSRASCFVAALPQLPLRDGTFRMAVSWGVLYILGGSRQMMAALREVRRILEPTGLFLSSYRTPECVMSRFAGEQVEEGTYRISEKAPPAQQNLVMSFWSEEQVVKMHRECGLDVLVTRDIPRQDKLGCHHFLGVVARPC